MTADEPPRQPGSIAGIQEDLREFARLRTLGDLRSAQVPDLRAIRCLQVYAGETDFLKGEAQCAAVQVALTTLTPGEYQDAAVAIFAQTEGRWDPLAKRQEDAARAFHVGFDAFRRKRSDGRRSRFDEVIFELALVLESLPLDAVPVYQPGLAPKMTPPVLGSDEPVKVETPAVSTSWLASRRVMAGAGITLAVVVIALLLVFRPWDESSESAAGSVVALTEQDCSYLPGETGDPQPAQQNAAALAEDLYRMSGGFRLLGCPGNTVQDLGNGEVAYQELDTAQGDPNGALVVPAEASAILLNNAQWESYRQIGGKSGDDVYSTAGYPVGTRVQDGASWVELDEAHGVLLVGESADGPHFFIVKIAADLWLETGAVLGPLGLPTSNPHTREGLFTQEFRGGYADLLPDGTLEITMVTPEEARAELPDDETLRGRILRQKEATAWWVNDELERLWIPSSEVFNCLGGFDAVAEGTVSVRGYAVQTLQYGGVATCEDR
jgi:hypothetical protein